MAGMAGGKTRNFEIVMQNSVFSGDWIILTGKETLLIIVARPPGEDLSHIQFFAFDMSHHVFGQDPLCRILIMTATGGMNMMVAGIVPVLKWIHPSLQLHAEFVVTCGSYIELL